MSDLGLGPPPEGMNLDDMTEAIVRLAVAALGQLHPGKEYAVMIAVAVQDGADSYAADVTGVDPARRHVILAPLALNLMQEVASDSIHIEVIDHTQETDVTPMRRQRGRRHRRRG